MSDARPTEPEPTLDDDALAMLRAYRAEERIPAEVHERVWSRVEASVGTPPGRWLRYGAVVGGLAAAALAVLWVGGQVLRGEPRAPATSQAGYERREGAPGGTAELRTPEEATPRRAAPGETQARPEPPSEQGPAVAPESLPPTAPHAGGPSRSGSGRRGTTGGEHRPTSVEPTPAPAPAPGSTLAEETRILSQARADLIEGEPEQALTRLGEHARRFPEGMLSEERQALRAVALCEAGRDADGEAAARSFLREHPHAALAQRVRSACLE